MRYREFELTKDDHEALLAACEAGGNASFAEWERLGRKLGFDIFTAQPVIGKGTEFFYALEREAA